MDIIVHEYFLIVITGSSPSRSLQQKCAHQSCSNGDASHDRRTHESLFCDFVIDQLFQASGLQVRRLQLQQEFVISSCLSVITELVIAERKVVETFASSFAGVAENLREKAHTFLLLAARVGLYKTL